LDGTASRQSQRHLEIHSASAVSSLRCSAAPNA
jgi:putative transposase